MSKIRSDLPSPSECVSLKFGFLAHVGYVTLRDLLLPESSLW